MPKIGNQVYGYIGVDPGKTGGLSMIDQEIIDCCVMPASESDIWEWFLGAEGLSYVAVIEKVWPRPGNAAGSTFKFGTNYGFLRACLIAAGIPFEEVTPQKWMKGLGITPKKKTETPSQWKQRLRGFAQQLFPGVEIPLPAADSLLIAEFCRRKAEGKL